MHSCFATRVAPSTKTHHGRRPARRRRAGGASDAPGGRWAAYDLVLRRLAADDHLCAALVCRAFRDVLFALTSVKCKKKDGRGGKGGQRVSEAL